MLVADDGCAIAIVGGGCSGVLVAAQLLRNGFGGRVIIIEPRAKLGRGLAYSTPFARHLLNVPAGKMSAFRDRPHHFLDWLRTRMPACPGSGYFAPRTIYGEYLENVLETESCARGDRSYRHIRAEVTRIEERNRGIRLTLSEGPPIQARKVVLALGNPLSGLFPGLPGSEPGGRWQASPWLDDALKVRFAGERILLIGAGLTAVDSVLALQDQDYPSRTWLVSRRGILPGTHIQSCAAVPALDPPPASNARLLLRWLRAQIAEMEERGICWRVAIDALRASSNEIWGNTALPERARFLRHLKPYWEPHRHRMAPEVRSMLDRLLREGNVQVLAGRIRGVSAGPESLDVRIRQRNSGDLALTVDRIIDCSGIQERYSGTPSRPLVRWLVDTGLAEANDLGIGFRTDGAGALVAAKSGTPLLFTLGPPRRGELFETTAVPEIRVQAELLALRLIEEERYAVTDC